MERVRPSSVRIEAGVNPRPRPRPHLRVHTRGYAARTREPLRSDAADAFARIVEEQIRGPVLPYSRRTTLIALAARRGIGRFEANLIIATVQHRRGQAAATVREPGPRKRIRIPALAAAGAVQSVILLYGWWVWG